MWRASRRSSATARRALVRRLGGHSEARSSVLCAVCSFCSAAAAGCSPPWRLHLGERTQRCPRRQQEIDLSYENTCIQKERRRCRWHLLGSPPQAAGGPANTSLHPPPPPLASPQPHAPAAPNSATCTFWTCPSTRQASLIGPAFAWSNNGPSGGCIYTWRCLPMLPPPNPIAASQCNGVPERRGGDYVAAAAESPAVDSLPKIDLQAKW